MSFYEFRPDQDWAAGIDLARCTDLLYMTAQQEEHKKRWGVYCGPTLAMVSPAYWAIFEGNFHNRLALGLAYSFPAFNKEE